MEFEITILGLLVDVKLLGCLTELIIILTKVSDEAGIIAFCKSPNSD